MENNFVQTANLRLIQFRHYYGDRFDTLARILVCIAFFFLIISQSLKALMIVAAVLALFGNQLWKQSRFIFTYKMNYFVIALMLWLVFAAYYNDQIETESRSLLKYARNLFLPFLLLPLFVEPKWRRYVLNTLIFTAIVINTCAYIEIFKLLDFLELFHTSMEGLLLVPWSIFVAFVSYILANRVLDEPRYRMWYLIFLTYLLHYMFLTNIERTGMVVVLSLFCLLFIQHFGKKGFLLSLILVPLFVASGYFASSLMQNRINDAIKETTNYFQQGTLSAVGFRLGVIKESINLIKQEPWTGYGMEESSEQLIEKHLRFNAPADILGDPHNIYLQISLQAGLIGLIIFIGWLVSQIFDLRGLPLLEKRLLQGLILTFVVSGNFENSLSHTRIFTFYVALLAVLFAAKISARNSK